MREESSYCDVTLASDDGHTIDAHRVILTAGSEFFGEVCRQAGPSKLFLYLKGIKRQELENVVDFLYNGQTYLAQEELNKFLESARELRVKGLESEHDERQQSDLSERETDKNEQKQIPKFKEERLIIEKDRISEKPPENLKSPQIEVNPTSQEDELVETEYEDVREDNTEKLEELDLRLENVIEMVEGKETCKVCGETGESLFAYT